MPQLSINFSLEEMMITQVRGVDNTPSPDVVKNLRITAAGLEKVRALLGGKPILISSGYRSPEVNGRVGGSPTSDHPHGWCADFICPAFGTPLDICRLLAASAIKFDQVIEEETWTHISFAPRMRQEVLTKAAGGYVHGLPT